MTKSEPGAALLFGSISTIIDTSELQRQTFNEAFAVHGLDWTWSQGDYQQMLKSNGGQDRVSRYAAHRNRDVNAAAIHTTKSDIFQRRLAANPPPLRPGVGTTIAAAKRDGILVGLVTTTTATNVAALLTATGSDLQAEDFDIIVNAEHVDRPKPDSAAYTYAVEQLGVPAQRCVAVEDNVGGVQAAVNAGVRCLAFPNTNTAQHEFTEASAVIDTVDFAALDLSA